LRLYLASNSPRRRQLISLLGWNFNAISVVVDEKPLTGEHPDDYVLRLAESKTLAAMGNIPVGNPVIGADTVVVDRGIFLGKPEDEKDALRMLQQLRGHTHQVYTGIIVQYGRNQQILKDLCVSQVPMRTYDEAEIQAYIASQDPLDKAGAYAIQSPEFHPVDNFSGCYASVMGLPLCHLARLLRKLELSLETDIAEKCQENLDYICPIYMDVLQGAHVG
jgi:MAF protein